MIWLLLALYPKRWRQRYGDELRALLADTGLTPFAVMDLLAGGATQHLRQRPVVARLLLAALVTIPVEVVAVHANITDNILWPPTTPIRALALAPLVLAWLPVGTATVRRVRRREPVTASDT